jgi:ubiquinone/menaquinone biosynthesis C-methylase UbiE
MARQKLDDDILNAPAASGQRVTESPCDQGHHSNPSKDSALPSKRRRKRIALYQAIIGRGHKSILEIGCGSGDLTYALVNHAEKIVAIEISAKDIALARMRCDLWSLREEQIRKTEFIQMSATQLDFDNETFDWAISTSVVEHLRPEDVGAHLSEVRRVLKAGGKYLLWCPNRLGRHRDQDGHLTMLSYHEWMEKLTNAGFGDFRTTLTSRLPMVDARMKVFLERWLSRMKIKLMWSHLGVRNVLLVAGK